MANFSSGFEDWIGRALFPAISSCTDPAVELVERLSVEGMSGLEQSASFQKDLTAFRHLGRRTRLAQARRWIKNLRNRDQERIRDLESQIDRLLKLTDEKAQELTNTINEQRTAIRLQEVELRGLRDRIKNEERRANDATSAAEEAATAAGMTSRVSIRLMEHLDQYIHNVEEHARKQVAEEQKRERR